MKTLFTLLISAFSVSLFAADLYVQEFGGGGTYGTITDAYNAANAGDRILILPKSGNAPYIESLTIGKSIQLLSASSGARFYLQGSITVSATLPAASFVVIDGMQITTGSISGGATSTNPVDISIVNCNLQNGTVSFGQRYNLLLANNSITTTATSGRTVSFCKGNVLGNVINAPSYGIECVADATSANDTVYIIGNRVTISGSFTSGVNALVWASQSYFFFIANNNFSQSSTTYSGSSNTTWAFFRISNLFKSGTNSNEVNTILNNTVTFNVANNFNNTVSYYGIEGTNLNSSCNVFNNLVHFYANPNGQYGFNVSGTPQVTYNNVSNASFNAGSVSVSGNTLQTVTLGSSGCITSNLDLGHPNAIFTDLDLTRNDWGACGGSFNISQNYPTGLAGTAKVHLVLAPRRVLQGGTISINTGGHDR